MVWPFARHGFQPQRPQVENRGYTDAIVQAIIAGASGSQGQAEQTAALEIAAGVIGRAFAAGSVEGPPSALELAGDALCAIGRDLVTQGESVWIGHAGALRRASSWDVGGRSVDAAGWNYRVQLPAPDGHITVGGSGLNVVHARYSSDRSRPWVGVGPIQRAELAGKLAANMELRMGEEAGSSVGHVLPLPVDGEDPSVEQLKIDLANLAGKTVVVQSVAAGWGEGRAAAPAQDWIPRRLGATFSPSTTGVYSAAQLSVLAACGVPVELVHPSDGTGQREAWRRFLHGTVQPLSRMVAGELSRVLAAPVRITFEGLFASDIAGRARAFQSMVGGGLDIEEAARQSGLVAVDD